MDRPIPRRNVPGPQPGPPPAPHGHHPLISVTPETLPAGQLVRPLHIPRFHGVADHWLLLMDLDQVNNDAERLEATYLDLHGPARPHIWNLLGIPDPEEDPIGYRQGRWWRQGITIDLNLIRHAEIVGRAYPWHHGRAAGPTLSPSRA